MLSGTFNGEEDKLKNDQGRGDEEIKRGKMNESRVKGVTCYLSLRSLFALFTPTLHDVNLPASPAPRDAPVIDFHRINWVTLKNQPISSSSLNQEECADTVGCEWSKERLC